MPFTVTVSDLFADELRQWAEDEQKSWPTDTAYQDQLADLLRQLSPTAPDPSQGRGE